MDTASVAKETISDVSGRHRLFGTLMPVENRRIVDSRSSSIDSQNQKKRQRFTNFLYGILFYASPGAALPCAAGIGQDCIAGAKSAERTRYLESIRSHRRSGTTISGLDSPTSEKRFPNKTPITSSTALRSSRHVQFATTDTNEPTTTKTENKLPLVTPSPTFPSFDVPKSITFENAALQGVTSIFGENMCLAIRRVAVQGQERAAVTMVIPRWSGPVSCLMSLEVNAWSVERFTTALFNVKVKRVHSNVYIISNDGATVVVSNSELTLKGVSDEAIMKVFGPDIHKAIVESSVRIKELREGKRVTECVSMVFTGSGAIINLALSSTRVSAIRTKLFP